MSEVPTSWRNSKPCRSCSCSLSVIFSFYLLLHRTGHYLNPRWPSLQTHVVYVDGCVGVWDAELWKPSPRLNVQEGARLTWKPLAITFRHNYLDRNNHVNRGPRKGQFDSRKLFQLIPTKSDYETWVETLESSNLASHLAAPTLVNTCDVKLQLYSDVTECSTIATHGQVL